MILSKDFREFVTLLNERGVDYLVVGGYAIALYGYPRYTGDLDVWVRVGTDNAGKLMDVLVAFGFGEVGLTTEDFLAPDAVIQLGYPPLRIDIMTSIDGVTFELCHSHRNIIEIDGISIPFIGFDDLITNKKASGRHQDLADLEHLE